MRRFALMVCAMVLFSSVFAFAGDPPAVGYAKSLKGQQFVLRAHEGLFGTPTFSAWDGRPLYETQVSLVNGDAALGAISSWKGMYFVSGSSYTVKDIVVRAGTIQLKLWENSESRKEPEVKLDFNSGPSVEEFKKAFFSVFFEPSEDRNQYIQTNNRKLLEKFIDPEPELFLLPEADRLKLLASIRMISLSPQPKLERVAKSLYVPATVIGDTSVYNDVRVSKNVRIASSIEALLNDFRRISKAAADFPEAIAGTKFQWNVYHRDFLNDSKYYKSPSAIEHMEMLTPREALKDFADGNLSPFELVQKSILRENGVKVSLTSYDPIGSR